MDIKIVDFKETCVAVLEHRGAPGTVLNSAWRFIEWRKQRRLSPTDSRKTFGVAYDDPKTTEPAYFRFDICGSVKADVPPNPQGVITKTIPAGRYGATFGLT